MLYAHLTAYRPTTRGQQLHSLRGVLWSPKSGKWWWKSFSKHICNWLPMLPLLIKFGRHVQLCVLHNILNYFLPVAIPFKNVTEKSKRSRSFSRLTSLTDSLSFFIGALTPIPFCTIFCIYAGCSVKAWKVFLLFFMFSLADVQELACCYSTYFKYLFLEQRSLSTPDWRRRIATAFSVANFQTARMIIVLLLFLLTLLFVSEKVDAV